ncbi:MULTISPECIES: hypothetical protein [unclassified Streptomyces]|uniref:hypothetical protein n=1 Tax=unclassified Streptomyces TaxID=2593676 RepID=UPI0013A6EE5E|nr:MULTISPECIES: hypothetical protein [unclassified Streptomyces]
MTERLDLDPSDGPWLYTLVQRIHAARGAGDEDEAARLLAYGRAEGGETLTRLTDQMLDAVEQRDTAHRRGKTMEPLSVSAAPDGALICDFCAGVGPVVYYEVTEFGLGGAGGTWLSGDRFYACPQCRALVDADDWKGLREWIGPKQLTQATRMILMGFRQHRQGEAVEFEPGTNPEAGR